MIDITLLIKAIEELDEQNVLEVLNSFVESNPNDEEARAVIAACQQGMAKVGDLFETNEYYIGDLIFAGEIMNQAFDILKPVIGSESSSKIGKIVLGTVQGDLHDIGKNIFKNMAEAAGFEVIDLGIDQSPNDFLEKVRQEEPDIIGMSGVLTLALNSMKKTVDQLKEAGLRENIKIIIGGNPVTEEACKFIGADAFTTNAAEGVKICQGWIK